MSDDRILLHGLSYFGYHGVQADERRHGQRFLVDVELTVDTRGAGTSDDLGVTVDYAAVERDIRAIVEGPPCNLIEAVAERIASTILAGYQTSAVLVRVRKPDVPMPATLDAVGVEIVRRREARG